MTARDISADWPSVTRFEVIDHRYPPDQPEAVPGRILTARGVRVRILMQDDGRTLKVVLSDRDDGITEEDVAAEIQEGLGRFISDQDRRGPWIS